MDEIATLLARQRWVSFATIDAGDLPCISSVAVALERTSILLHLSELALHTRNVVTRPAAAVLFGEPDSGVHDPQTLARLSVTGRVTAINAETHDYDAARSIYVDRFPASRPRFGFADFRLFRLTPMYGTYVGGFARAHTLDDVALAAVLARIASGCES